MHAAQIISQPKRNHGPAAEEAVATPALSIMEMMAAQQ